MDKMTNELGKTILMTGNEAIARGVYEAGVEFASAYPGTPSTEILENITQYKEIFSEWSVNEKVALEFAIGCAVGGSRAFCSMKHVGVNVAADPLLTVCYSGTNAGLVIVTADEPGQHSSQNEQDNRNYAKMARMPMLCPADSQECLDMVKEAYEIFDTFKEPVFIRMTTRVCHSKSPVKLGERKQEVRIPYQKNAAKYVCVPANARVARKDLEERYDKLKEFSNNNQLNRIEDNGSNTVVIADGICYYYAKEVFGNNANYLKIGMVNPLPEKKIKQVCENADKVYVIEENDPIIEDAVRALGFGDKCYGKFAPDGQKYLPPFGELTSDVLRAAIFNEQSDKATYDKTKVLPRPPALCAGCPHRGVFYELGKRKKIVVSGDIGCYTLGFAPPYNAMDFNCCMGASISSGAGLQRAFDKEGEGRRVVAVLGDSTFFHSGMTGLMDVVYNKTNLITMILDNRITGMTGHQENPGSGYTAMGEYSQPADIAEIVKAIGVRQIKVINPNKLNEVNEALDWALSLNEPSVIITRYPCVLKKFSEEDKQEFPDMYQAKYVVDHAKCVSCKMCLRTGCPALFMKDKKSNIERSMCVGCGVCSQVCKFGAISKEVK